MYFRILFTGLYLSCATTPPPRTVVIMPPTENITLETSPETIYTLGYMSEYDIWEFLKENPSEKDVLDTFGFPDSVWLDDQQLTKYFYYYISKIRDYNTIEISTMTDSVSGFEWD